MKMVWKFQLQVTDGGQHVRMPKNATLLAVGMQGQALCLWALVDLHQAETYDGADTRTFVVHGTGHAIFPNETWVGSVQDDGFVWHVFEAVGP